MWSLLLLSGYLVCVSGIHRFPPGFKFGASTSAFQVEGAWNVSDKSPSIWDVYLHQPKFAERGISGDVTCDSYHLWKRDIEVAKELGLHFYRFSLSWPRLLPSGFPNHISEDGTAYYNNLIDGLLEAGIEPVVTLYQFDLPQTLQDLGGWCNPHVTDWFADYATVAFRLFGDRIKTWSTLNEPFTFCEMTYNLNVHAPGISSPGVGSFLCMKNTMIAHAKAWRIYDEQFRPSFNGRIAIVNHHLWYEPVEGMSEETAELARQMFVGMYAHPIYSKKGGWPPSIEKIVAENSKREGYARSRLPSFTEEEKKLVRGTFDYYGFNHYTGRMIRSAEPGEIIGPWPLLGSTELDAVISVRSDWIATSEFWLYVSPGALRKQLKWLKKEYGDVEIMITENGYPDTGTERNDRKRIEYIKDNLQQVLTSIYQDGVNITAYTVWSMMDNLEWSSGYAPHFGLYAVDFSDPARPRTPRASAHYYSAVIRNHTLDVPTHYYHIADDVPSTSTSTTIHPYILLVLLHLIYLK